jgi:hypothetical protein
MIDGTADESNQEINWSIKQAEELLTTTTSQCGKRNDRRMNENVARSIGELGAKLRTEDGPIPAIKKLIRIVWEFSLPLMKSTESLTV